MVSDFCKDDCNYSWKVVLILVLMEDGLWLHAKDSLRKDGVKS